MNYSMTALIILPPLSILRRVVEIGNMIRRVIVIQNQKQLVIQIPKLTKRVKVKGVITIVIALTVSQRKMILVILRKQRKKKEQNKRWV